ncbi:MAG TPA: POTRA domain-containing protein, partial [Balneolaceae bacterium]|nr:POTRA domain-containing protein [Balneolaceae bacterium]
MVIAVPGIAVAQNSPALSDTTDKVVRSIRFVGNEHVSDNTLEELIRTHTNREFLGIPRFTPWYFIWQLTGTFGEPPALLNHATVVNDIERIEQYYQSIGFLNAAVDTSIVEFKEDRVEVSFLISEGHPFTIKTLRYTGMPQFKDSTKVPNFLKESPLTSKPLNDSTYLVNERYSENSLTQERLRIINFLKNNGYAAVQRDSVNVLIKTDSTNQYRLHALFAIDSGQKYTFGDLYISLAGPGDEINYQEKDTVSRAPVTKGDNSIYLRKEKSAQTDFSLLTDQILFTPGATFNNALYIRTINEFQNLGMLTVNQFGLSKDG